MNECSAPLAQCDSAAWPPVYMGVVLSDMCVDCLPEKWHAKLYDEIICEDSSMVQSLCSSGNMACIVWCKCLRKPLSGKMASNAWCKCLWKLHCDYTVTTVTLFQVHVKLSMYCDTVALLLSIVYKTATIKIISVLWHSRLVSLLLSLVY